MIRLRELLLPDYKRAATEGFDAVMSRLKSQLLLLALNTLELGIRQGDILLCFSARSLKVQYIRATDRAAFALMSAHALSKGVELADLRDSLKTSSS